MTTTFVVVSGAAGALNLDVAARVDPIPNRAPRLDNAGAVAHGGADDEGALARRGVHVERLNG